jgi:hypothetical protein
MTSPASTRRWRRRVLGASTVAGVPVAIAVLTTVAVAGAVVVAGAICWGLWRWPRWEERLFSSSTAIQPYRRPWMPPTDADGGRDGLGPEGHRAFAKALHAVTTAYLADCEREADQ